MMKLNEAVRFPHPVLSPFTDDYRVATLSFELTVTETLQTGSLVMSGRLTLVEKHLNDLVLAGLASCRLVVVCEDTYHCSTEGIALGDWNLEMRKGLLVGAVSARPIIVAMDNIEVGPEGVHEEFGMTPFSLGAGMVVALGEEVRFEVGLEKLAPMESIFKMVSSEDVPENQIAVNAYAQAVQISVSPALMGQIAELRQSQNARKVLLSSVYLPAVVELLSIAAEDSSGLSDLRWFRTLRSKCAQLGLDMEKGDNLLEKAQVLLSSPIGLLRGAVGGIN